MQVNELESNGLKKNFKIAVGADAIGAKTESKLVEVGKTAKIAGFRSGKVPMKVLKQMYGKAVLSDVLDAVIKDSVSKLVTEKNFRPAVTPNIKLEEYNEGGDLAFSVAFELFPDLPELDFSGITIARNVFEISEADIDEAAQKIAERSPKFVELPESSKAENGNIVRIDFKGTIDGVAFDGGAAEDFELELGSGQFIGNFEEQLVGAKAGDSRVVKVSFPEDYHAKNLAGKPSEFAVTVKAVLKSETPTIDEEFAKARGFADLAAFRDAVRTQITKEYDAVVRNQLKKELFDQLEAKFNFDLPETMVEMEFKTIWERVQQSKAEGDEELKGKSDEELTTEYKKVACRRVTLGILLAEVGTKNKIQISRDEISQAVWNQARFFPGQERMVLDFYQKNPQRIEDLRGPILEEKAVDLILTQVKFNDKKVALSELENLGEE